MTVTLELKPRVEKRLAERAKKEGKPFQLYLEEFIEKNLEKSHDPGETLTGMTKPETNKEWKAKFRAWLDSHKDKGYPSIPSEALRRENMYEDRF